MHNSQDVIKNAHNLNRKHEDSSNRGSFVDISVQDNADGAPNRLVTGSRGIDKLVIHIGFDSASIQITDFLENLGVHSTTNGPQFMGGVIAIKDCPTMHVKWRESLLPNGKARYKLRIEFNPSDFRKSPLLAPCPFADIIPVCREVIELLIKFGDPMARPDFLIDEWTGEILTQWPEDWPSKVLCTRVDLTQDFYVDDPRFQLSQLHLRKPAFARGVTNHINGKRVNTVTHIGSDKYTKMKIYDKYQEHKKHTKKNDENRNNGIIVKPGHVRYEVLLKYKDMKNCGLLSLSAFKSNFLSRVLEQQWEKSTYGKPLFSEDHFMKSIIAAGLTVSEATVIFYYLYCRQRELEYLAVPDRTLRELRKTMKELGIRVVDGLNQENFNYGYLDIKIQGFVTTSPIVYPVKIDE
jgi:hypothetical protein